MHYIILALYALGISSGTITDNITPRLGLENQYFMSNSRNDISQSVPSELIPTGILSVKYILMKRQVVKYYFLMV